MQIITNPVVEITNKYIKKLEEKAKNDKLNNQEEQLLKECQSAQTNALLEEELKNLKNRKAP